nr:hypothetical protein [Tanacetum cinerariifolium]
MLHSVVLPSGFHEAYKLHSPTNTTTTPPFTSTNELIHDCNPINTETHHHQTTLPPNAATTLDPFLKIKSEMPMMIYQELDGNYMFCFPFMFININFPRLMIINLRTGMDAQVAYGFHDLRNEKPYLAQGD